MTQTEVEPRALDYLPEPIPAEHFDHPFYARVADTYWQAWDKPETMPRLVDALADVVEHMEPSELLGLANLIETDFPNLESDCGAHTEPVWLAKPTELSVDEKGLVHGVIGHISAVKDHVLRLTGSEEDDYAFDLNEHLEGRVYGAAYKYRDEVFATYVDAMLNREQERRYIAS